MGTPPDRPNTLAAIIAILSSNAAATQDEMAALLGLTQSAVCECMKKHGLGRRCASCGSMNVTAAHNCGSPDLRLQIADSSLGSLLAYWEDLVVSDLGRGSAPIVISTGEHEWHLTRPAARMLGSILGVLRKPDRLVVLRNA